jgi:hypothetical protein
LELIFARDLLGSAGTFSEFSKLDVADEQYEMHYVAQAPRALVVAGRSLYLACCSLLAARRVYTATKISIQER